MSLQEELREAVAAFVPNANDLLDIHEVRRRTSLSTTTIYEMMKRAEFPLSYRLGTKTVRWRRGDIEEWVASLRRG